MSSQQLSPQGSYVLPKGASLFRVHRTYRQAISFNSSQAFANDRDGRFDSDEDDYYPFYYAALSASGALYETLVAEASLATGEPIPRSALCDRMLSAVELTRDVTLISLRTKSDLALVGQEEWLVRAKPNEYPLTRYQVRSLRSRFLWAEGLIWYSRKNPDEQSLVLFGDRCDIDSIRKVDIPSLALDTPQAEAWLSEILAPHALA